MEYKPRRLPSENFVTIKLCHLFLLNNINFDVEYSPDHKRSPSAAILFAKCECGSNFKYKKCCYKKVKVRSSRFDIILFKYSKVIAIIEVKKRPAAPQTSNQLDRYASFNVPVLLCRGLDDVERVFRECKKIYEEFNIVNKQILTK
jgi:hypothetical protein